MTNSAKEKEISWSEEFAALEKLVIEGEHKKCRKILISKYSPRSIPREWVVSFVQIAYRVQLPAFVLKTLHRFIYPENRFDKPASDREKINYASALYTFGALSEALEILKTVNLSKEPEALFHTTGVYFCDWNYADGIPLLQKYISHPDTIPYRRAVGKLNLISAKIMLGDWPQAEQLITNLKQNAKRILINFYSEICLSSRRKFHSLGAIMIGRSKF